MGLVSRLSTHALKWKILPVIKTQVFTENTCRIRLKVIYLPLWGSTIRVVFRLGEISNPDSSVQSSATCDNFNDEGQDVREKRAWRPDNAAPGTGPCAAMCAPVECEIRTPGSHPTVGLPARSAPVALLTILGMLGRQKMSSTNLNFSLDLVNFLTQHRDEPATCIQCSLLNRLLHPYYLSTPYPALPAPTWFWVAFLGGSYQHKIPNCDMWWCFYSGGRKFRFRFFPCPTNGRSNYYSSDFYCFTT